MKDNRDKETSPITISFCIANIFNIEELNKDKTLKSKYTKINTYDLENYDVFQAKYDEEFKVDSLTTYVIKNPSEEEYNEQFISSYFKRRETLVFKRKNSNILLFTRGADSLRKILKMNNALKILNKKETDLNENFRVYFPSISIEDLRKKCETIGSWFKKDNAKNLSAIAYYGNQVDKSQEFQDLISAGAKMSSITIKLTIKEENNNTSSYVCVVSNKCSIRIMNSVTISEATKIIEILLKMLGLL